MHTINSALFVFTKWNAEYLRWLKCFFIFIAHVISYVLCSHPFCFSFKHTYMYNKIVVTFLILLQYITISVYHCPHYFIILYTNQLYPVLVFKNDVGHMCIPIHVRLVLFWFTTTCKEHVNNMISNKLQYYVFIHCTRPIIIINGYFSLTNMWWLDDDNIPLDSVSVPTQFAPKLLENNTFVSPLI